MKKLIIAFTITVFSLPFGAGWGGAFAQTNQPGSGNCLQFDGTVDWVGITHAYFNQLPNWTWEGWVYVSNSDIIYSEGNPLVTFAIWVTPNMSVITGVWNMNYPGWWLSASSNSGAVTGNSWNHIAITLENGGIGSGTIKFYVNGLFISSATGQAENNATTQYSALGDNVGAHYGGNQLSRYFNGRIDEVRVWNYARSQAEIRRDMCRKLTGSESGLIGYWRMDEGSGITAFDSSQNANDGTLY